MVQEYVDRYVSHVLGIPQMQGDISKADTRILDDTVNIMDKIMSEAQRQGRLSFYMVGGRSIKLVGHRH